MALSTTQGIALALVVYLVAGLANQLTAQNIPYEASQPLYDAVHRVVPDRPKWWADAGLVAFLVYFGLRWGIAQPKLVENFLWMAALLFLPRVFAFSLTRFPPCRTNCSVRKPDDPVRWWPFAGHFKTCNDLGTSGHTIHVVLITLIVLFAPCSRAEKVAVVAALVGELYLIEAGRLHYSCDLVVGTLAAVLMFYAWPGIDRVLPNLRAGGAFGRMLATGRV